MADTITITFSWMTVFRIGLAWAAEYAMLSLIEDAPEILKVATLICAVAGLAILQFEDKIKNYDRKVFGGLIGTVAIIYLGFTTYAVRHGLERQTAQSKLREIYVAVGPILDRQIPTHGANLEYNEDALTKFQNDAKDWEDSSQKWLLTNLGAAARERFLDMSAIQVYCWGKYVACDPRYDGIKNKLIAEKRNLSAIMETSAYGQ
jgi:hypothetical protein